MPICAVDSQSKLAPQLMTKVPGCQSPHGTSPNANCQMLGSCQTKQDSTADPIHNALLVFVAAWLLYVVTCQTSVRTAATAKLSDRAKLTTVRWQTSVPWFS